MDNLLLSAAATRHFRRIASSATRLCKGMIYINTMANSIRYRCLLGLFWKETLTMKRLVPILLAAASIGLAGPAMAAEVDMSKATCKEVGALPAAKTIGVAMWVNGYVHGKAGNAMVDTDAAHANAEKIADYCKANPNFHGGGRDSGGRQVVADDQMMRNRAALLGPLLRESAPYALRMPLDAQRAVTIGWLIAERIGMGAPA